ncbi:MAG: excinuclease ABC subunit UvrA [Deltaproteobacteria bacterium]|nr:excinuclease ABC subunit UvrA [Deltaproteobacteria bacterium]MCB9785917.1 excinuclease ABC subunit UvrA [Deltaproteobacteria bacterium]
MAGECIKVRGAREHNLQRVDLDIPKQKLVVFTGVSGSGKSSLAFDTLFAEGQRRYVESLSAYARQFLGQMEKPAYDSIHGLCPTIAIEQKSASQNPRSTVGTVTEIYDYLRVLFARAGVQYCPTCGRPVGRQSPEQVADLVSAWPEGTRFVLLAPLARRRKGTFKGTLEDARREGFVRARIDGEIRELAEVEALDARRHHDVELVVDRLTVREGMRPRLVDSIETAFRHGSGMATVLRADTGEEVPASEHDHCAVCERSFAELTPASFSFNSPLGSCPECHGLGSAWKVDEDRLVPDPGKSLREGAVMPWASALARAEDPNLVTRHLLAAFEARGVDPELPWSQLAPEAREALLHAVPTPEDSFEGAAVALMRRWRETRSDEQRAAYQAWFVRTECPRCGGARLREEALHVRVGDLTVGEAVQTPVDRLGARLDALELDTVQAEIAREILREISGRLRFLVDVGLGYLTLARTAASLSGGESQRIRLASQIGTELTGVLYILDEPSIGLHPRDNRRLLGTLRHLRDLGNSLVVVEHDAEVIESADWLVDFGPGAGTLGGHVVAAGLPAEVAATPESITGAFMSGRRRIAVPASRRRPTSFIRVVGAREHNLRDIDVDIPLGVLTVVTGVSGAGKSTLIEQILRPALQRRLHGSVDPVGAHRRIDGLELVDKLVDIDQQPIGRTPRSNPATYSKLFDEIRRIFASTREAKMYGYEPGRFSFNVKGGRCETCSGDGAIRVEMHFLADVFVTCEACGGRRFNAQTLRVRYQGLTIADVLELTVDQALELFRNHKRARRILETLHEVGLGYVALGQASNTLSGGEAQRVKLARELARADTGNTMYILDEPSTGLHFADVERLLAVLDRLVEAGNSVVMVEHHLDIIKAADHIIDLGPEGGGGGGQVMAVGTPEEVAASTEGHTAAFLREALAHGA